MVMRQFVLSFTFAVVGIGCAQVFDIDDLFPCEVEFCPGGGGAGGGDGGAAPSTSTSTSTSTTTSSTGGGTPCFDVTVTAPVGVEVKLEGPQDLDFTAGAMTTHCVFAGPTLLEAECADGENKGDPISVTWGNPLCVEGTSCTFTLAQPETFALVLSSGAVCPP